MSVPHAGGIALLLSIAALAQDLSLTDLHGNPVSISVGKGNTTVVVFLSTICPVSNTYNLRINELYRDYAARGVNFAFINPNQNESAADVEGHSRRVGFTFPVYRDVNNVVADRFGAQYTPEAFVIDGAGVVRYRGRIDDAQNPARVQQKSLRLAIEQVMAGGDVPEPETKAFGCTIKRARKTS